MKKNFIGMVALAFAGALLVGCGATATAAKNVQNEPVHSDGDGEYTVIDWDGKDLGISAKDLPDWVLLARNQKYSEISSLNKKVPFYDSNFYGEDLEATLNDIDTQAASQFAQRAIQVVVVEAEQSVSGNREVAESIKRFSERNSGFASEASFNGLERLGTYWTRERYSNGRLRYHVYALYGMGIERYEANISQWIDDHTKDGDSEAVASIKKSIKAAAKKQGFASAE